MTLVGKIFVKICTLRKVIFCMFSFKTLKQSAAPSVVKVCRKPLAKIVNSVVEEKEEKEETLSFSSDSLENDLLELDNELLDERNCSSAFDDIDEEPFTHVELRIGDPKDPLDVVEYENIIYREMRNNENNFPTCCVDVLITESQRGMIVDWMNKIHYKTQLTTMTLHRAVGILDRAINCISIHPEELKYYAAASLLMASKIEDIYPIRTCDFEKAGKEKFDENKILAKEIEISNAICFNIVFPTPLFFLNYFLRISGQSQESMLFARYIIELCFTTPEFIDVKPSALASVAIIIMRVVYGEEPWTKDLADFTQYSLEELRDDIRNAYSVLTNYERPESKFVRAKYGSELFMEVAQFEIPDEITK